MPQINFLFTSKALPMCREFVSLADFEMMYKARSSSAGFSTYGTMVVKYRSTTPICTFTVKVAYQYGIACHVTINKIQTYILQKICCSS